MHTPFPVAALQMGSNPAGTAATLAAILACEAEIAASGARLVVLPEALLGGYPKGETFGAQLGFRTPEGRARFAEYHAAAVTLDGPEIAALAGLSARTGATLVVGIIERAGASLFCTAVFITPEAGLIAHHRKLKPTAIERLIWAEGDGSTMPVVETPAGKLIAAICWENQMPLFRAAMYAKGPDIWCAPTVDDRDIWRATMRHIANEGRQFVISACQSQPAPQTPIANWPAGRPLIAGGSLIIGPLGDILAGPLGPEPGLLTAEIDLASLPGARFDLDVSGHYARPDLFTLHVDERPRINVSPRRHED
ncbi:nitrilase [Polymorphobacter multimanifer]|uniref:carbon-nitrogen hydrolase family protein n=1 Tax=Polymorphobacter multimanifer TaxID=1070431 RepID=UPI001663122C|nr:carbon-nitrogen hydrolase family protein [Polymorphobacter multimanifer]GGI93460.1 nitrilase [Polymorphobacter multimanifer]